MEPKTIASTRKTKIRTIDDALTASVQRKTGIDAMLAHIQTLSNDHFGVSPDDVSWSHVGTLEHHAELLKRITDMAFGEGEQAA